MHPHSGKTEPSHTRQMSDEVEKAVRKIKDDLGIGISFHPPSKQGHVALMIFDNDEKAAANEVVDEAQTEEMKAVHSLLVDW